MQKDNHLLIGAHTSAAGGVHHALIHGKEIGATTIQLFTSNQRQWKGKEIPKEEVELWKKSLAETGIQRVMSHASYLLNLGAPDPENLTKSRQALIEEFHRCQQLGISFLNFHPGAHLKESRESCLDRIVDSLIAMKQYVKDDTTRFLLESTAGQGSCVGCTFEDLNYIIEKTKRHVPIGVCIDTCHIFVSGYDIRTEKNWDDTLTQFDKIVGLEHLYAFHVNDSQKAFASRVDRHADLGKGEIGIESFRILMTDKRTKDLPKYLETPSGMETWTKEIIMLRGMYKKI